ncbi:MAG: amidoligase family protein [Balneolia bacterium]|nr:amidoligase family protein [Balneolia bacterium]
MKASPYKTNHEGKPRRMGVELEFSGLTLQEISESITELYGGTIAYKGRYISEIHTERFKEAGSFAVELDASLLKDGKMSGYLDKISMGKKDIADKIEDIIADSAMDFVPMEIVSPPILISDLPELERLRASLQQQAVEGTRSSVFNAFGLHLNPELPSLDPSEVRDFLRAFILMYDWLEEHHDVDTTRHITPYIDPFPKKYARLIMQPNYEPDITTLIDDYLTHNPTRNRPLDMLPLFTFIDEDRVMAVVDDGLTSKRPTFHYRLPNCDISNPNWTLKEEWNRWVVVERIASNKDKLEKLTSSYLEFLEKPGKRFVSVVGKHIKDWFS